MIDHGNCSGNFENGAQIVDKIRQMGFNEQYMPMPFDITCVECGRAFEMATFEGKCPQCSMVYGVTPCHAFDPENIMPAGINY